MKIISVPLVFLSFGLPSSADDSQGDEKQSGGGLILNQREDIAVISKEVYVSTALIEINYVFLNRSRHDITATVTFPLPPRPVPQRSSVMHPMLEGRRADEDSLSGLEIWVGSEKINPDFKSERVTDFSRGYGSDVIRTTYAWEQTFPAGAPVDVRHRYRPVVGTGGAPRRLTDLLKMADSSYCPDAAFTASVHYKAMREKYDFARYYDIGYVLREGENWAGGTIGNFRLVVDKGSRDALMTFCGTDIRKIAPTKFEMRAVNFLPRRDLNVLILCDWARAGEGLKQSVMTDG